MNPNDGGPAYPSHGTMGEVVQQGMSLRDHFAGLAMQAMIQERGFPLEDDEAKKCYAAAGTMLRAKESGA